jgi:hypothetical protein
MKKVMNKDRNFLAGMYMCIHIYVCIYIYIHNTYKHVCVHRHVCLHTEINIYLYTYRSNFTIRHKDRVLLNLSADGSVYSGRILGILGPSGSGKTTFLNALSGLGEEGSLTHSGIYIYIHMYVFMYICICICVYMCICICTYVCM